MLEFDGTIIIAMISFVIFMILMNVVLYEPMRKIVEKRRALIDSNFSDAKQNKEKADELALQKDERLDEARIKSRKIIADISQNAKDKKSEILADAHLESVKNIDTLKAELDKEKKAVQDELKDEIVSLAQEIASKVSGSQLLITDISGEKIDEVLNNGL